MEQTDGTERRSRDDRRRANRLRWLSDKLAVLGKQVPLRRRLHSGVQHGGVAAAAAVLAYVPTQALGLREGFWGAITALAVVQTEFGATRSTARDQFLGAAIGGAMGLGVLLVAGQHLASYALAVVLSIVTAWLINIGSAARLSGITATIILLVPHSGSPERMFLSRVFEVGWGVAVALAVVWIATRILSRFE